MLKRLVNASGTTENLKSDVAPSDILTAVTVGDKIYWSTGIETGVIDGSQSRILGFPQPPAPILSATSGSLPAGHYLAACTYMRDGQEGPASAVRRFEFLEDGNGLVFSGFVPVSSQDIDSVAIYISRPSGDILYRGIISPISNNSVVYANDATELKYTLRTQYLVSMPAGHLFSYFRGHLLAAKDNILYYSEPHNLELYHEFKGFVPFQSKITNIGPVRNGVFVTLENQTIFLSGVSPVEWEYIEVSEYGAPQNSLLLVNGDFIGAEGISGGNVVVIPSDGGLLIGTNEGVIFNATPRQFHFSKGAWGSSVVKTDAGQHHILTIIRG